MFCKVKTLIYVIYNYFKFLFWSFWYSTGTVKTNKIIFWSFRGRTYSCNPKYITEYILKNCPNDFELVWAFDNIAPYHELKKNVKLVKFKSREFFKELMSSKFIITNTRIGLNFHKRCNQIYIQTWHGTMALKTIERDAWKNLKLFYVINSIYDSRNTDFILSGCSANTEIIKKSFWYKGTVLEIGNPRNDVFFDSNDAQKKVFEKYKISKKILLYAPTFRSTGAVDVYDIDYDRLVVSLKQRFKEDFVVLARLHPNIKQKKCFDSVDNVIDVSDYDDMQDLLAVSDILLTDFSSSMFDFALMKKMCILYASDYDSYIKKERKLYFDVEKELPFPLAKSNDDLNKIICEFDDDKYFSDLENFCGRMNFVENGSSSLSVVKLIAREC